MKGTNKINEFLKQGCRLKSIAVDRSSDFRKPVVTGFDGQGKVQGVQTFLTTESDVGRGMGVARLVEIEGKLKAFTLFTSMRELKGHEEATFGRRPEGVSHGGLPGRKNWQERRVADENYEDSEPTVLILGMALTPEIPIRKGRANSSNRLLGAGQGGLTPAARLKMLGVSTLIIDRNERVGDNWRQRYHQLVLHDPVWYDHLPYINFPAKYVFSSFFTPVVISHQPNFLIHPMLILIQLAHIYAKGQARRIL